MRSSKQDATKIIFARDYCSEKLFPQKINRILPMSLRNT
jgi:hypothetical protein